ncbi:flagellar export protein FliJ [Pueribacillus theae]|uniref:Flagellar FliJ protein n=2 Tax=Pueribacillus theae TaxID=2171751 RepID=A0A2U1K844_9BACI|nr:flagellar export protein FliJ [Pueribacillus theae]
MKMAFHFRLDKVLTIKEKEKNLSELEYADARQQFEKAARRLYELLKKKEDLEKQYEQKMQVGVMADSLLQYSYHLQTLQTSITQEQLNVNRAKFLMEGKHQKIIQKSVEVKKYNRLKEKHFAHFKNQLKKDESKQLDELSLIKPGEWHGI